MAYHLLFTIIFWMNCMYIICFISDCIFAAISWVPLLQSQLPTQLTKPLLLNVATTAGRVSILLLLLLRLVLRPRGHLIQCHFIQCHLIQLLVNISTKKSLTVYCNTPWVKLHIFATLKKFKTTPC